MREVFVHFQKKLLSRPLARTIALCLVLYTMLRWRWPILAKGTCSITVCTTAAWSVPAKIATPWRPIAAWINAKLRTLRTVTVAGHTLVFACGFPWWAICLDNFDVIIFVMSRLCNRLGEFGNSSRGNSDMGFVRGNADGANVVLGYAATATQ
jgi:hypothetical protein